MVLMQLTIAIFKGGAILIKNDNCRDVYNLSHLPNGDINNYLEALFSNNSTAQDDGLLDMTVICQNSACYGIDHMKTETLVNVASYCS